MSSLNRDVAEGPTPLPAAPPRTITGLPESFTLTLGPSTSVLDDGRVLLGGAPSRLWRLSTRAHAVLERWLDGEPIGQSVAAQRLARRLASTGALVSNPTTSGFCQDDVTVVVPVRDRSEQLDRVLSSLKDLRCVVVDDASVDVERNQKVALDHGAQFIAMATRGGPAAARNAGLAYATSQLVAFVDSDCMPETGWLEPLLGHFDDPLVAAVSPRVIPLDRSGTVTSRYEAVRSSLDRGERPGLVRPLSPIPYVPSAALLVRRDIGGDRLFDPSLSSGEDVDLVWRLTSAGWDVRYEPRATVQHDGPRTLRELSGRRFFYGTSAAPLAQRHPESIAPLHASAWSVGTWVLLVAKRPVMAVVVLSTAVMVLARRLNRLVAKPFSVATRIAGGGTARATVPALASLSRAWAPALVAALLFRRTRRAAAAALLIPAASDWLEASGDLGPASYTLVHIADDVSYGAGVWMGCLRQRTVRPLLPRVVLRSRVWSSDSLRAQLRPEEPASEAPSPRH